MYMPLNKENKHNNSHLQKKRGFNKCSRFELKWSIGNEQVLSLFWETNTLYPKTHKEDKINLIFLGIKWSIEVDMPLNKTLTLLRAPGLSVHKHLFSNNLI